MIKLPGVAAAALLFAGPVPAQDPEDMETVLVTGEQPGPGLWKVSRDGHVMWVLGSIGALPDTITWRTKEIEARIAESQAARREVERDLAAVQSRLSKFKNQLMEVKTNKEYQAMQKEMSIAEQEISDFETRMLERMEEADVLAI